MTCEIKCIKFIDLLLMNKFQKGKQCCKDE